MNKVKKVFSVYLVACMLFLFGCEEKNDEYVFFTSSEHAGEQLLNCLDENNVKYTFDSKKDLLVKKTDSETAIAFCS